MKIKLIIATLLFVFTVVSFSQAQEFELPANIKLEKPEDYAAYEPDILRCIEYLETSPLGKSELRQKANSFLITWLTGAPNVSVDIHPYLIELIGGNNDLLIIFMGGWTKYALQNPADKDKINGQLAGLRAIIKVYLNNPDIEKNTEIEELIAAEKAGTLAGWLQKKLEVKESASPDSTKNN